MYLSNTSLTRFLRCPQYGYYKYILQLEKDREGGGNIGSSLAFGQVVHKALEDYGKGGDKDKVINGIYSHPDSRYLTGKKNLMAADVLVRKEIQVLEKYDIVGVEESFQFTLGNHFWIGRWDSVVKDNGLVYVIDYKTTMDNEFNLRPNDQIVSYYIGATEKYGDVGGVYIHLLRVADGSVNIFLVRPTKDEVWEWRDEKLFQLKQIEDYINRGIFPKNPSSCHMYGRACEYLPLCQAFGKTRDILIKTQYKKVERRGLNEDD